MVSWNGKSLSSDVMKITELPVQAREFMIWLTVAFRKASPVAIKLGTWEKSQGSDGVAARPCISWHWSGLIQEKSGTVLFARSVENWLKSTMFAMRAGFACTS